MPLCVRARVVCVDVESGGFILLFAPHPFQKRACLGRLPSYLHLCVSRRQICTTAATFLFFYQINHPALIQIRGVGFVIFLSTGGGVLSLMHAFEVAEC